MTSALPPGYRLRGRIADDDSALVGVEHRAAQLFRAAGHPQIADLPPGTPATFARWAETHEVLVAEAPGGALAGFVGARPVGGFLHAAELSVDPAHGRRGIGRALVEAVAARALDLGLAGVSLSTFRAVPFNAPFYAALGFAELPFAAAPPELARLFRDEVPDRVDPAARLLMVRSI